MLFNNLSVIKRVAWSQLKQHIDLDVRVAPHCAFLNVYRKVVLFYRDPSDNYIAIDPKLYDVTWELAEGKTAFSDRVHNIKIKKSQFAKTGNTRHHYKGYNWLFQCSPVDVAIFQHYGHVEPVRGMLPYYDYILEKNTEIYMLRDSDGNAVEGHTKQCIKYSDWCQDKPKKLGFTKRKKYHADGSVTTEHCHNGELIGEIIWNGYTEEDIQDEETLYKVEETELEKMVKAAEESGRKESGIDFLYKEDNTKSEDPVYKGEDTNIKFTDGVVYDAEAKTDVATLTINIPANDIADLINILREKGVKEIHLQL